MTTQQISITDEWRKLKDLAILVDDKAYTFQNIGSSLIYFAESVAEPEDLNSARQVLVSQIYSFVAVGSLDQWVRTITSKTSIASVLEEIKTVNTILSNGIPDTFTAQTSTSRTFLTQKGQLNHYRFRQAVLNEHVETARSVQGIVNSTTIVGQIFKASQDNINGLMLTLQTAESVKFDDFEDYADSAALQAVWVETTNLALLETVIVAPGGSTKSMKLSFATLGDSWTQTIPATDFTDFNGIFSIYQDETFAKAKLAIVLGDGVNTKSLQLVIQDINTWTHFNIPEAALIEDGAGTTDMTAITKVSFRVDDKSLLRFAYVDNYFSSPPAGSVGMKLFDMGSELPETGVDSLNDGTQYEALGDLGLNGGTIAPEIILPLLGGKREYLVTGFAAGPALEIPGNEILIPGNYYAVCLNYIDTNISVYGANPDFETIYYNNGYAFTVPDVSTPISKIGVYSDLQFGIFSTQDAFINTLISQYNALPGNDAIENVRVEDKTMKIKGIIVQNHKPQQVTIAEFKDRFFNFPKGGKFEVNHSDDFTDSVTQVDVLVGFLYEPPTVNG